MKRVCVIVPSFSAKGGITSVVKGYRESQIEKEYNTTFIETYCDGNKIKKILKAVKSYFKFLGILLKNKPDLIHVHSSFGGSFYRKLPFIVLGHLKHIPIINHIHGSELDKLYTNASSRKKKRVRSTFDKCSCIIVLSEELKDALGIVGTKAPITVINNYSVIQPEPNNLKNDKKNVLFMGFITQLKGCCDLPVIAKKVIERVHNVTFVLAGSGDIESIRHIASKEGVVESIQFPGWLGDSGKGRYLRDASIFVLPSYTEAMPMSILEAMGYGLPVISTRVGGIPKLVEDGFNGYLYEPGDVEGISEGIIKLLENEDLISRFGSNGYEKAKKEFSYEHHIRQVLDVYKAVLTA